MSCSEPLPECIAVHILPVIGGRAVRERPFEGRAACPACRKKDALKISAGTTRYPLLHCHAGCGNADVVTAMIAAGVSQGCLPRPEGRHRKPGQPAEVKRVIEFITDNNVAKSTLRLGLLIELGCAAEEARQVLGLTKTTYYRALNQIPTRR